MSKSKLKTEPTDTDLLDWLCRLPSSRKWTFSRDFGCVFLNRNSTHGYDDLRELLRDKWHKYQDDQQKRKAKTC